MTSSFPDPLSSTPYTQHTLSNDSRFDFPSNRGKNFTKFYKTISNQLEALYNSISPNLTLYRNTNGQPTLTNGGIVTVNDIINGFLVITGTTPSPIFLNDISSELILSLLRDNCYNVGTPVLRLFIYNSSTLTPVQINVNNVSFTQTISLNPNQGKYVLVYLNEAVVKYAFA